ncbi:MAG: chorismate-binding protein [Bacteroidota bacterium]
MKGFLAYKFPVGEVSKASGDWVKSSMAQLPNDVFFVTDFNKEDCYFFKDENTSIDESKIPFTYRTIDSVFVANRNAYLNGLDVFMHEFEPRDIQKAVFSRIHAVEKPNDSKPLEIFDALVEKYGDEALVYLISDPAFGTWMGATPEVLLKGGEESIESMALAGTKSDAHEEWTEKEYEEQAFVEDYIEQLIRDQSPAEFEKSEVKTVKSGAVFHLRTNFKFRLPPYQWNALIDTMHPTPAVCGTPSIEAKALINDFEPHERAFYAGLIGKKGLTKLDIFVNLRCMQVLENEYALYVGGGITQNSDLASEWRETEEKSQTLLNVLRN